MWVVYRTVSPERAADYDFYHVEETRQQAEITYALFLSDPDTYTAGIAPIMKSTDAPHHHCLLSLFNKPWLRWVLR